MVGMEKRKLIALVLSIMMLMTVIYAGSLAEDKGSQSKSKDVYIDNTVDNSKSYVTGMIHITGSGGIQEGYDEGKTVYENTAAVTYSNPKTAQVQGMINDAYTKVNNLAKELKERGKTGEFHMSTSESTGKVWDNRKYTTVEDGDAVLIGDSDYLQGAYGVSGSSDSEYTRTHIASGDYGKESFYRVEANGWVKGYSITVTDDGNGKASASMTEALKDTVITLTATPNDGYQFGKWQVVSGDVSVSDNQFTVGSKDIEIKAIFAENENADSSASLITSVSLSIAPPAAGTKRLSADPDVEIGSGASYTINMLGWLEQGGGMSTVAEDYTFEEGKTYYASIWLKANDGYAFKSGAPATGNYEKRFTIDGTCDVQGGSLYTTAITGDSTSGTEMVVVATVVAGPSVEEPEETNVGIAFGATEGGSYSVRTGQTDHDDNIGGSGTIGSLNITAVYGEAVTLKASPAAGYTFAGWYEGLIRDKGFVEDYGETLISSSASYSFEARNTLLICAVFEPVPSQNDEEPLEPEPIESEPSEPVQPEGPQKEPQPDIDYEWLAEQEAARKEAERIAAEQAAAAAAKKEKEDTEAAQKVIDLINALPNRNDILQKDRETVENARAAYDALTADQKGKVKGTTWRKLTGAEAALAGLSPASLIDRYYLRILGRYPDEAGYRYWVDQLLSEKMYAAEIAQAFVNSEEFRSKNLDDAGIVSVLSNAMLNLPEAPDAASWIEELGKGGSLAGMINGFGASNEFDDLRNNYGIESDYGVNGDQRINLVAVRAFVGKCYQVLLKREPDNAGLNTWSQSIASGKQEAAQVVNEFISSKEFTDNGYSQDATLNVLYQLLLNRQADEGGREHWITRMSEGFTFAEVIEGIMNSEEYLTLQK